jgi:aryl-alcohol dehydrogenase-like predicted oxidoreductase
MRTLGRTGVKVSLIGLGGYHLGLPRQDQEAIRIIHFAQDQGVTFFDNCWDYHEGKSEERLGRALADGGRRQKVFVMTKLDGRTKKAAAEQLEQSLRRLKTDVIDLVQMHEVIRMTDAERIFAPDGAIEALIEGQKAGKLRFMGFTGHKDPAIHLHMLETAKKNGFTFDSVQLPINVLDAHYKSFEINVVPALVEQNIAVLGMKPMGAGIILQSGVVSAEECLRYAMGAPTSVVITGCETMGLLKQALAVAFAFKPMTEKERRDLLARTVTAAADGRFEQFKTTERFDGTTQYPRWLETAEA